MAPNGPSSPTDFKQSGIPPVKEFTAVQKIINHIVNLVPEARTHIGANVKKLEAELEAFLPQGAGARSQINDLNVKLADMTKALEALTKDNEELEGLLSDSQKKADDLAAQLSETQNKSADLLEKAQKTIEDLKAQLEAAKNAPEAAPAPSSPEAPTRFRRTPGGSLGGK